MCIFQIHVQGDARLSEIVSHEVENTELAVEDVMCNVLLHLFGGGTVEDVTVQFFSDSQQQRRFSIQIYLQCACQQFVLFPPTKERMQQEVEKHTRLLLRELFVSLEVDRVELVRTPWVYDVDSAPECSHCCSCPDRPRRREREISVD